MIASRCIHDLRPALLPRIKPALQMPLCPSTRTLRTWHGSHARPTILSHSAWNKKSTSASKQILRKISSTPTQTYRGTMRVIWGVIGLNVVAFLAWSTSTQGDRRRSRLMTDHMTLSWRNLRAGRYHTILTNTFSHYNALHLFVNMFGLWTFGGIAARCGLGALKSLSLLIGSALTGSLAWLYEHREDTAASQSYLLDLQNPNRISSALGASGMLMGTVAAATCLAPKAPMLLLGVVPMPLYFATAGFVAMDLYYLDKASKIGHSAHLGGAVFGALFYFTFLPRLGGISAMLARRRF